MKTINFHRYFYLTVAIFILSVGQLFAQSNSSSIGNSGSFYSLFGVGFPIENNTARESSLGIFGVSLDNAQSNSLQNPALWGKNAFTTTSSGFSFSKFQSTDNNSVSINSSLQANYFQLTLPILRERFGVSASLYPVTRSNYRFLTTNTTVTSENETLEYISDAKGSGGINKFEIGFGWNINKNLAIGYAPSLVFISQDNSRELYFNSNEFGPNIIDTKITGSTFGHRFGALLTFKNLLRSNDRISIGSSFIFPINISTNEKTISTKIVNNQTREVVLEESHGGAAKLPVELTSGLTYYPSPLVNISLEGKLQKWSDAQSSLNSANNQSFELSDRAKLGLGGEYHPYKTNSTSFLSNFRYSAGVSYDTGHLQAQGQDINTLWFSAGLGIISPFSNSTIDLSAQYGLRGTTSNNLIREKIWAFNISVNLSELMFFRPKLN